MNPTIHGDSVKFKPDRSGINGVIHTIAIELAAVKPGEVSARYTMVDYFWCLPAFPNGAAPRESRDS